MDKLVSIVLPVYNGEKYLRESIESVISQTYTNWELIIVDDCSKDKTAEIAKEYAEKDGRIQYYLNEKNLRLPRNLNKGFSLARGDYLTWTSDDNVFLSNAIETLVKALEDDTDAEFAFSDLDIIDEYSVKSGSQRIPKNYFEQIIGTNIVGACFLYTRKVYDTVGDYQHGKILVEDYDYWQRIFAKYKTVAVHEVLYKYRVHSSSLTGTNPESVTNKAYKETMLCNRPLFGKITLAQKYYYYYGLYRCAKSMGSKKYTCRYKFYKVIYYVPKRLGEKINGIFKHK